MSNKIGLKFIPFIILVLFVAADGQNLKDPLSELPITMSFEDKSPGFLIYYMAKRFDIQFGIEEAYNENAESHRLFGLPTNLPTDAVHAGGSHSTDIHSPSSGPSNLQSASIQSIDAVDEPLGSVLDKILAQIDGYEWEISDGVVNIFPSAYRDSDLQSILNLQISSFTLAEGRSVGLIRNNIVDLPEIKNFLSSNRKASFAIRSDFDYLDRPIDQAIQLKELTLRQLLNRVTKVKKGAWILRKVPNSKDPKKPKIEFEI